MQPTSEVIISVQQAVAAAHAAFFKTVFSESSLTDAEQHLARKLLADPMWRPLCELVVNGVTSYEGGLVLKACDLVQNMPFVVRGGPATGTTVTAVELNNNGVAQFSAYCDGPGTNEKQDFHYSLIDALRAYAAIDSGSGLIAKRSAIEGALEFDDWDLLKRLKHLPYGSPMFRDYSLLPGDARVPRGEYFQYVASWDGDRTGTDIVALTP